MLCPYQASVVQIDEIGCKLHIINVYNDIAVQNLARNYASKIQVSQKGDRSRFINEAVQYYIAEKALF